MSKINDILDEFITRTALIAGVNTPVKRPRAFTAAESPGISVYRGQTELIEQTEEGPSIFDLPVSVDYYKPWTDCADPSAMAEAMIDEILAAIETTDGYLSGTLCEPVYAQSDDVRLPDDAGGQILATVTVICRFVRQYGGAA